MLILSCFPMPGREAARYINLSPSALRNIPAFRPQSWKLSGMPARQRGTRAASRPRGLAAAWREGESGHKPPSVGPLADGPFRHSTERLAACISQGSPFHRFRAEHQALAPLAGTRHHLAARPCRFWVVASRLRDSREWTFMDGWTFLGFRRKSDTRSRPQGLLAP